MENLTYYEVLEVPETATQEEIKAAYRRLAMEYHPDRIPIEMRHRRIAKEAADSFRQVREAYEILSDPDQRRRYDEKLRELRGESDTGETEEPASTPPPPSPSSVRPSSHGSSATISDGSYFLGFNWVWVLLLVVAVVIAIGVFGYQKDTRTSASWSNAPYKERRQPAEQSQISKGRKRGDKLPITGSQAEATRQRQIALDRARRYIRDGNLVAARKQLEHLLKKHPDYEAARRLYSSSPSIRNACVNCGVVTRMWREENDLTGWPPWIHMVEMQRDDGSTGVYRLAYKPELTLGQRAKAERTDGGIRIVTYQ